MLMRAATRRRMKFPDAVIKKNARRMAGIFPGEIASKPDTRQDRGNRNQRNHRWEKWYGQDKNTVKIKSAQQSNVFKPFIINDIQKIKSGRNLGHLVSGEDGDFDSYSFNSSQMNDLTTE